MCMRQLPTYGIGKVDFDSLDTNILGTSHDCGELLDQGVCALLHVSNVV